MRKAKHGRSKYPASAYFLANQIEENRDGDGNNQSGPWNWMSRQAGIAQNTVGRGSLDGKFWKTEQTHEETIAINAWHLVRFAGAIEEAGSCPS